MFYLAFAASTRIYVLLQRYAPTSRLMAWLRRRENLRWGLLFMPLGAAYLLAASTATAWVQNGGPGWANLLFLWGFWNGMKFLLWGPWSVLLLAAARIREAIARRRARRVTASCVVHPADNPVG